MLVVLPAVESKKKMSVVLLIMSTSRPADYV